MSSSCECSQLFAIAPTGIVGLGGMLVALTKPGRERTPGLLAAALLVLALAVVIWLEGVYLPSSIQTTSIFGAGFLTDPFTWFFTVAILAGALITVLLSLGQLTTLGIASSPEFYGLLLMTTAAAIVLVGAGELITLFIGLEALSMGLYCLCGSAISSRRSVEGALKYFILGSFSSAFFLYGISALYGVGGSTELAVIAEQLPNANRALASLGIGLVLVGVFFKLGAVPFHFWAPDVYQGAPTPVTAYMASVVKAAAVAMAMRLLWTAFGDPVVVTWWSGFTWMVALLTMIGGNIIAVRQRNVKRMLAYSSIAHVGYMTAALLAPSGQYGGGPAILFYVVVYSLATFGAFAVSMVITGSKVDSADADDIGLFSGLGKRSPALAATMSLFLLAMAGLPPGVVGLVGKFYLLSAVVNTHYLGLAIIAGLCSAVSCYYYLRVVMAMYFQAPANDAAQAIPVSASIRLVLAAMVGLSLLIGLAPSPLYNRAQAVLLTLSR